MNAKLTLPTTVDIVLENLTMKDIEDILSGLNGKYTDGGGAARELRSILARARLALAH